MMRVLVTGASGFIGRALAPALACAGHDVIRATRAETGDIGPTTDWTRLLDGVEAVVHLGGIAHRTATAAEHNRVTVEGSRALAEQAACTGVKRLIFTSSVKAAAERSERPLVESDPPRPETAYGRAKLVAESVVLSYPALHPLVLRPPLVHGPDARGNFALLLRIAGSGLPMPFARMHNRRSVVARETLVDAIMAALSATATGVFYVADHPPLSTSEILTSLRKGLKESERLFEAPALTAIAPAPLRENLEVDDACFRAAFKFEGRDSRAALAATAAAWKAKRV